MPRSLQPLRGKGPVGTALCFPLPMLEQGCFGSLDTCPFALCTDAYVLMFRAEVCGPRAKCRGQSREQLSWSKLPCFPFPSIPDFVPTPPLAASPSPCQPGPSVPAVTMPTFWTAGAVPHRAPRQSSFCRGQSRAGGGRPGCVPPNTNEEGQRAYPCSWGEGEAAGSVCCKAPPPTHTSWGEGEGRPLCSPREQRVSVARDSSKETQGNKCATNRWGGYLGKDAARRAGGQPPPWRAARR